MTQKITPRLDWEISDKYRAKAQIKYELSHLKCRLRQYLDCPSRVVHHADKIINLCRSIAAKYESYLHLFDSQILIKSITLSTMPHHLEHFESILNLEQKLTQTINQDSRRALIQKIIMLYQQVASVEAFHYLYRIQCYAIQLKHLFVKHQLLPWLVGVANFWTQHESTKAELAMWFREWDLTQQKIALGFFAQKQFIDLVNAIFFFKLYPDKLFNDTAYPEKLLSVQTRLAVLHYAIELMQEQLYNAALQNGLAPPIDYLLHGNELPQGTMIEVDNRFKTIIWAALKQLKITTFSPHKPQATLELLYNLRQAYKFWFNPNRLIDTAMVLRQAFFPRHSDMDAFQQQMISLYRQLPTAECLDLYGYFANDDTRFLLYTFFAITQGGVFDWIFMKEDEKKIIDEVFKTLSCVLESLRDELRNRHVLTDPYRYQLVLPHLPSIGYRNREAVRRVLAIYGSKGATSHDAIEELFRFVEAET